MISGQPYTSFRAVSVKDGTLRVPDPYNQIDSGTWAVTLQVASATLTGNRNVYVCDGSGSMVLKGYDILYGTSSFAGSSNLAVQSIGQASVTITGVVATCIVLVSAATSAQVAGYVPIGSKYASADKIWVFYKTQAATAAVAEVPINYTVLFPQTT